MKLDPKGLEAAADELVAHGDSNALLAAEAAILAYLQHAGETEPVAWACKTCGCKQFARIHTLQPDGSFAPGPDVRCVECKVVSMFAAPHPHQAPDAPETPDWAYLAACLDTHADKFPVPEHIRLFIQPLRNLGAASASNAEAERLRADGERMDWLVSQDVEVRTPLLYGSRANFVAQALSGEEDEDYRTDLREQIDRARALQGSTKP